MGTFVTALLNLIGFTIRKYIFKRNIKYGEWYLYNLNNILVGILFLVLFLASIAWLQGYNIF